MFFEVWKIIFVFGTLVYCGFEWMKMGLDNATGLIRERIRVVSIVEKMVRTRGLLDH